MIECQTNATEDDDGGGGPSSSSSDGVGALRSATLSHEELNLAFVSRKLTETDKILEEEVMVRAALRVWHLIFIVCAWVMATVVTICCFVRLRIPRTKAEIEANAKRRALLRDFRAKLRNLKAAELDDMDYRRALDKLREEFKADNESLAQSEAISILSLVDELPDDDEEEEEQGQQQHYER